VNQALIFYHFGSVSGLLAEAGAQRDQSLAQAVAGGMRLWIAEIRRRPR
jgi:hypothetical protein